MTKKIALDHAGADKTIISGINTKLLIATVILIVAIAGGSYAIGLENYRYYSAGFTEIMIYGGMLYSLMICFIAYRNRANYIVARDGQIHVLGRRTKIDISKLKSARLSADKKRIHISERNGKAISISTVLLGGGPEHVVERILKLAKEARDRAT